MRENCFNVAELVDMRLAFFIALLFTASSATLLGQDAGSGVWPAAMSLDYNPLLWRGEDARFALDMLHGSQCEAALSKVVASRSSNPEVQALTRTLLSEEHK